MTIEQRVAVLEEIFSKLQDYYTSAYSGEEIDARLASAGVPIGITKEYKSVAEMNQDFTGTDVQRGQFVLILPDSTASADYGKVYLKGTSNWVYAFTLTTLTSIKGPIGPPGKKGDQGDPGEAGSSFAILGYFDTLDALKAAVPNPKAGDVYGVGTAPPYNIYIWDSVHGKWVANGNLQGPQGKQGIQGPEGKQGPEGPVGGSSNFVRYDAAQNLTDAQKAQARTNINAAIGAFKIEIFDKKGWYRIVTCNSGISSGILTLQHNYGSGGPTSLKFLVTLEGYNPSLKCIDVNDYEPQFTNARIVKTGKDTFAIDVYYDINFGHYVSICFIRTGREGVAIQALSYIADSDTLPNGETLLAPMEYLNPPMKLGVEYRTTERYLGKPVYVKTINMGNLPGNAVKQSSFQSNNVVDKIVSVTGQCTTDSGVNLSLPCHAGSGPNWNTVVLIGATGAGAAQIVTFSEDFAGYTDACITVKYTKLAD